MMRGMLGIPPEKLVITVRAHGNIARLRPAPTSFAGAASW
jgi:hypothetical protein